MFGRAGAAGAARTALKRAETIVMKSISILIRGTNMSRRMYRRVEDEMQV